MLLVGKDKQSIDSCLLEKICNDFTYYHWKVLGYSADSKIVAILYSSTISTRIRTKKIDLKLPVFFSDV